MLCNTRCKYHKMVNKDTLKLGSFMSNLQNGLPKGLVHRAKIGRQTKKVDFFKVGDMLTMM